MKKPLMILAIALVLAVLCGYLYILVQPQAESDTLKVTWHAGGTAGVVSGHVENAAGSALPNQKFKLWMQDDSLECQSDEAGNFTAQLPTPAIRALEVPGSDILRFGAVAPSAEAGLTMTIVIR